MIPNTFGKLSISAIAQTSSPIEVIFTPVEEVVVPGEGFTMNLKVSSKINFELENIVIVDKLNFDISQPKITCTPVSEQCIDGVLWEVKIPILKAGENLNFSQRYTLSSQYTFSGQKITSKGATVTIDDEMIQDLSPQWVIYTPSEERTLQINSITPTLWIPNENDIQLPEQFIFEGSDTTVLDPESLNNIQNFTLDVKDIGKIEFLDPVNLSTAATKLRDLDRYISIKKPGVIRIDTEALPELKDKKTRITMRNLTFKSAPRILGDGQDISENVRNLGYNTNSGILTFEVLGYDKLEAVERDSINNPELSLSNNNPNDLDNGINLLKLSLITFLLGVVSILGYYFYSLQKKEINN